VTTGKAHRAGENPFRVERLHSVPYWDPGLDWEALVGRVAQPGLRGALVGPHGHGKTTLLLELGERLAAQGVASRYVRVGDEDHAERGLRPDPGVVYLIDGTDIIGRGAWWRLRWQLRRARGLIITVHRPGRLPTLHESRATPETLEHLLHALVPEDLAALRARIPGIFAAHGGDCRAMLFALYDEYAGGPRAEQGKHAGPGQDRV